MCEVINLLILVAEAPPGVYIYLGYSKKDALILQRGRVKLGKKVNFREFKDLWTKTFLFRFLIQRKRKEMKWRTQFNKQYLILPQMPIRWDVHENSWLTENPTFSKLDFYISCCDCLVTQLNIKAPLNFSDLFFL